MPKTMVSSSVKDLVYMFKNITHWLSNPLLQGGEDIYKFSRKDKHALRTFQICLNTNHQLSYKIFEK